MLELTRHVSIDWLMEATFSLSALNRFSHFVKMLFGLFMEHHGGATGSYLYSTYSTVMLLIIATTSFVFVSPTVVVLNNFIHY
jgi:hypothetical protein